MLKAQNYGRCQQLPQKQQSKKHTFHLAQKSPQKDLETTS